jgi:uncharacterized membrane protein
LSRYCIALFSLVPAYAGAQYALFGVGDLPGGIVQSEVRDSTRVGTVLHAVGGSAAVAGSGGNDTAFLWTSTGGMTAIPPLVPGLTDTNGVIGSAITPNAAFIAARARFNPSNTAQRHAVRVTTSGLAEVDLGALPGFPQQSVANAISSDGSVLYGFARYNAATQTQAVRYTADVRRQGPGQLQGHQRLAGTLIRAARWPIGRRAPLSAPQHAVDAGAVIPL